jgi:hypothetical protein
VDHTEIFSHLKCFKQYSKKSNDAVFMCSLNHTIDQEKRLGYANPNLINQLQLNPQINENNQKCKNMKAKSKIAKKRLTTQNRTVISTYIGQTMLRFQHKASIMVPYNFK